LMLWGRANSQNSSGGLAIPSLRGTLTLASNRLNLSSPSPGYQRGQPCGPGTPFPPSYFNDFSEAQCLSLYEERGWTQACYYQGKCAWSSNSCFVDTGNGGTCDFTVTSPEAVGTGEFCGPGTPFPPSHFTDFSERDCLSLYKERGWTQACYYQGACAWSSNSCFVDTGNGGTCDFSGTSTHAVGTGELCGSGTPFPPSLFSDLTEKQCLSLYTERGWTQACYYQGACAWSSNSCSVETGNGGTCSFKL
jgi:hypothetical protein